MRIPLDVIGQRRNATPMPATLGEFATGPLRDAHDRQIRDLRLSVTDRCNFRCVYCLEPGTAFMDPARHLTTEQLTRLVKICQGLGVDRVRLTGGEPTARPDLDELVTSLGACDLRDLSITTNGLVDPSRFERWKRDGLHRVTFSLDAASPDSFEQMTRVPARVLDRVTESIRAATIAGLHPVRVNAVILRDLNESQIVPLTTLARSLGVEMRFIEFMPLDDASDWDLERVVTADEIRETIDAQYKLIPIGRETASGTSLRFRFADGTRGGVGLIAPVSRPFCGACSRMRVTADGRLRPCLFSQDEVDLAPLLNEDHGDGEIETAIRAGISRKQAGHQIGTKAFRHASRTMSAIGG